MTRTFRLDQQDIGRAIAEYVSRRESLEVASLRVTLHHDAGDPGDPRGGGESFSAEVEETPRKDPGFAEPRP